MIRCEASNKSGSCCLNAARPGSDLRRTHDDQVTAGSTAVAIGTLVGHAVLPGISGALLGGATASIA